MPSVMYGPRGLAFRFDLNAHYPYANNGSIVEKVDILSGTLGPCSIRSYSCSTKSFSYIPVLIGEAETCKIASDQLLMNMESSATLILKTIGKPAFVRKIA
ncbi:pyridoxal phosphate-dependent transferase [Rhizophagus clarus]|uniref:Pyridoxal phosphate-dependent transferase n=1 Tax=Rhizophagus clarus TaxID=94130 RepID=A0A8H3LZ90_9GLOM|nr:pyridoxal phosphate-dependent transferase [Rhizophagus clarus]